MPGPEGTQFELWRLVSDNNDAIRHKIKQTADLLTDLSKIWVVLSILLSAVFVNAYLAHFDAVASTQLV
jgi:hypothetical protein